MPSITVVIPTLASAERAPLLERAVQSVVAQNVGVRLVIVANGPNVDDCLLRQLEAETDSRILHLIDANFPAALAAGRRAVQTPFFLELDDDDLLLPGTLAARLAVLHDHPSVDAVISSAILRSHTGDEPSFSDAAAVQETPLESLMRTNWMVPGCALFRTATVTSDFFACIPKYLEWTYLGMRLAIERRLSFLSDAGCVHNVGLPFSMNDSIACKLARPLAIRQLQSLHVPRAIKLALRKKECASWHAAAETRLATGAFREAWKAHLHSMRYPYGWRYLSFSRHLFQTAISGL